MTRKERLVFHLLPTMDIIAAGETADRILAAMDETPMLQCCIEQGCCNEVSCDTSQNGDTSYAFVALQPGLCHEHKEPTP